MAFNAPKHKPAKGTYDCSKAVHAADRRLSNLRQRAYRGNNGDVRQFFSFINNLYFWRTSPISLSDLESYYLTIL